MKKIIIIITTLVFALSAIAQNNTLKLNAGGLISKAVVLSYERQIFEKHSITIRGGGKFTEPIVSAISYLGDNSVLPGYQVEGGLFINPEYRMYLSKDKEGLAGFYWGVNAIYRDFTKYDSGLLLTENIDTEEVKSIGAGAQIGIQWKLLEHLCIDWQLIGVRVDKGIDNPQDGSSPDFYKLSPNFTSGLSLGVIF